MKTQTIEIPKGCRAIIQDGVIIIEEIIPEFKKGDIIIDRDWLYLFKSVKSSDEHHHLGAFNSKTCFLDTHNDHFLGGLKNPQFATEAEKQLLFNALAKEGKQWNAETMEIEDTTFPKQEEYYYQPCLNSSMFKHTWFDDENSNDIWMKRNGLCFRTKEEAIECTKKMLGK